LLIFLFLVESSKARKRRLLPHGMVLGLSRKNQRTGHETVVGGQLWYGRSHLDSLSPAFMGPHCCPCKTLWQQNNYNFLVYFFFFFLYIYIKRMITDMDKTLNYYSVLGPPYITWCVQINNCATFFLSFLW